MLVLIWLGVLVLVVTLFLRERYTKFQRAGVSCLKPVPLLGNLAGTMMRKEHLINVMRRIYEAFPNDRFVGYYEFLNDAVIIRDLDLIKQITVKDFGSFIDHRVLISENNDPLFGRNIFAMKGNDWKNMRSTLSPAFTSSKIKLMVPFMMEVGDQMLDTLRRRIQHSEKNCIEIEARDVTTRYANDVIASCAFGLKIDSQVDRKNEFYSMGEEITNLKLSILLKFVAFSSFPKFTNLLRISLIPDSVSSYFRRLVTQVMRNREEQNIIRPDMIHLLMEAKKGKLTHEDVVSEDAGFATVEESSIGKNMITKSWSDDDLIAQALLFLLAGFETVATVMTFLLYELARNKEVQDKLAKEIRDMELKNGGKLDFNIIQQLEYMDMVVSETLRFWTPVPFFDRICCADYNIGRPNSKSTQDYIVRKGDGILIPVSGIHMNPDYFPEPEKFNPERFSKENRDKIIPFSYMAFGLGPRNCIGSRFALCEVKLMTYQLIKDLEVYPSERTRIPPRLEEYSFNLRMKDGHWLKLKPRD